MNRWNIIPILFALLLSLALVPTAHACPSCQAALENIDKSEANSIELEKQSNMAAAFNQSIYMMVSIPYLLLGFFGLLIYRGMKKNEAYRKALAQQAAATPAAENPKPADTQ